jgi:hypothetical protein
MLPLWPINVRACLVSLLNRVNYSNPSFSLRGEEMELRNESCRCFLAHTRLRVRSARYKSSRDGRSPRSQLLLSRKTFLDSQLTSLCSHSHSQENIRAQWMIVDEVFATIVSYVKASAVVLLCRVVYRFAFISCWKSSCA